MQQYIDTGVNAETGLKARIDLSWEGESATGNDWSCLDARFKPKQRLFDDLDRAGFDQVPCPSNWVSQKRKDSGKTDNSDCAGEVVRYCRAHVSPDRLKGFMMAS